MRYLYTHMCINIFVSFLLYIHIIVMLLFYFHFYILFNLSAFMHFSLAFFSTLLYNIHTYLLIILFLNISQGGIYIMKEELMDEILKCKKKQTPKYTYIAVIKGKKKYIEKYSTTTNELLETIDVTAFKHEKELIKLRQDYKELQIKYNELLNANAILTEKCKRGAGRKNKLSDETQEMINDQFLLGVPITKLSERYEVSRNTIYNILRKFNSLEK